MAGMGRQLLQISGRERDVESAVASCPRCGVIVLKRSIRIGFLVFQYLSTPQFTLCSIRFQRHCGSIDMISEKDRVSKWLEFPLSPALDDYQLSARAIEAVSRMSSNGLGLHPTGQFYRI